jgi:hypothetical protein
MVDQNPYDLLSISLGFSCLNEGNEDIDEDFYWYASRQGG